VNTPLTGSLARIGGVSNLMQSAAYLVAGGATLFLPLERVSDTESFAAFYSAHPAPFTVLALALIALGTLGFTAVVPATAVLLDEPRSGWVTVGKSIALLSLAVIVVYYTWFLATIPSFVAAYRAAPRDLRAAIAVSDPRVPANWVTWFIFGGMGLWVVVVGVIGRLQGAVPRGFGWACAIKTTGFWIALAGILCRAMAVAKVGVVVGVLVGGPLYHAWLGIHMLRIAKERA
jgi:hypothetical protein